MNGCDVFVKLTVSLFKICYTNEYNSNYKGMFTNPSSTNNQTRIKWKLHRKSRLAVFKYPVVLYIFHCIFTFMTSIYVSSSLFVLVYLTEGNSKFLQEKTKMFIFSLYAVLPVCVNDQPNAYFCINVVCIKGCCTA